MTLSFSGLRTSRKSALVAALLAAACSSGSDDGGGSITSQMTLPSVSVTQGQEWKINRPIRFTFSQPVDFSTVDSTTINISKLNGEAAVGGFLSDPTDARVVVFQPACPTEADLSDAGLEPASTYRIRVADVNNSSNTVRSTSGQPLQLGTNRSFVTPAGTEPSELFIDLVPGAPSPRVLPVTDGNDGAATYVEVGLDDTDRMYFARDPFGNGVLPGGEMVPLNLYSRVSTRMTVVIELNQPVNPLSTNINSQRVFLEYLQPGGLGWARFESRVELVANCTLTGAKLRLTPTGVLPQNSQVRAVLAADFEDLVGNANSSNLSNFALMSTETFEEGGVPVEYADEIRVDFSFAAGTPLSLEDDQALLDSPPADWGNGRLAAAFDFGGTGGPGGDFDWHVPANTDFVFDTTQTVIVGGPDGVPTTFLTVLNGRLDIDDLVVPATSRILIQGNRRAEFLISGSAQIDGRIVADGAHADSVFTLNTPFQPEPGAAGRAGGGSGGTGSYLTSQSTPRGGNGDGPFGAIGAGGQGGESGWSAGSSNWSAKRPGGGGGGVLGKDVQVVNTTTVGEECDPALRQFIPDQEYIGLDAEDGFPGPTSSKSAIDSNRFPYGGMMSAGPFDPVSDEDDFLGLLRKNVGTPQESTVRGELESPTAGAGGGAGGDSTAASSYPPAFTNTTEKKGCGGGGGGGSFALYTLGNIVFGPSGQISANGGAGDGGENVIGWDRIGGGSGGGSGGHIIVQTASTIDMSQVSANNLAITAFGGQGGTGGPGSTSGGTGGGADQNTTRPGGQTTPNADRRHRGSLASPTRPDNPFSVTVCDWETSTTYQKDSAGGDGGPGLIQIHVGEVPTQGDPSSDITLPLGTTNIYDLVKPAPLGFRIDPADEQWKWIDQPVPFYGRFSKAQSLWVPLGEVATDPTTGNPTPITFFFGGTDPATGLIQSNLGTVPSLPSLLAPAADVSQPGLPEISADDARTILFDASELAPADVIFTRNPGLLGQYELVVGATSMTVATADYDETMDVLSVTVSSSGPEIPDAGLAELIPRYFRVETNGVPDALPSSSEITIEFQAAPRNVLGNPDEANATAWVTDLDDLNTDPNNPDFRYLRFRVEFDISAMGGSLTFATPRPQLDFINIGFRF